MLRKLLILFLLIIMIGCSSSNNSKSLEIELNPGVDTIEIYSDFVDAGAYATLDGESHPVEIISNDVDITQVGTYEVIYQTSYEDDTLQIIRYVDVVDETPPTITLNPGIDTITKNTEWVDAGVSVRDNSELDVTIKQNGQINTSQIGEYQITYTATDASGNKSTIIRYVYVVNQ